MKILMVFKASQISWTVFVPAHSYSGSEPQNKWLWLEGTKMSSVLVPIKCSGIPVDSQKPHCGVLQIESKKAAAVAAERMGPDD